MFVYGYSDSFNLISQGGNWLGSYYKWRVNDWNTSPCIDAGNPNSPIGLELFPNGGVINMGAYGGTDKASGSYFGGLDCSTIVAGDINGDCKIDLQDFSLMANNWLADNNP